MKKILAIALTLMAVSTTAHAQWGGGFDAGKTIKHRDTISSADSWLNNNYSSQRTDALNLDGYNMARLDYQVTGDAVSIVGNLMCSNDSVWVSGDAVTATNQDYDRVTLAGCDRYYFYVQSVSAGDKITVYVTPYNERQ